MKKHLLLFILVPVFVPAIARAGQDRVDGKDGGGRIIEADSMVGALKITKACPFLDVGGSLEVSELMQMPG